MTLNYYSFFSPKIKTQEAFMSTENATATETTVEVTETNGDVTVETKDESNIELKVAATTDTKKLASSIASLLDRYPFCRLIAIGAGAVNQAVKSVAIANGFTAPKGYVVVILPSFTKVVLSGVEKTGMRMVVQKIENHTFQ